MFFAETSCKDNASQSQEGEGGKVIYKVGWSEVLLERGPVHKLCALLLMR